MTGYVIAGVWITLLMIWEMTGDIETNVLVISCTMALVHAIGGVAAELWIGRR